MQAVACLFLFNSDHKAYHSSLFKDLCSEDAPLTIVLKMSTENSSAC